MVATVGPAGSKLEFIWVHVDNMLLSCYYDNTLSS